MELPAEPVQPQGALDDAQEDTGLGVLPPLFQDVVIRDPRVLQQVLQNVFLLDEDLHLVPVRFQGRYGVLVVMEMGGMAQVDQDPHRLHTMK